MTKTTSNKKEISNLRKNRPQLQWKCLTDSVIVFLYITLRESEIRRCEQNATQGQFLSRFNLFEIKVCLLLDQFAIYQG